MWKVRSTGTHKLYLLALGVSLGFAVYFGSQIAHWYQSTSTSKEILSEVRNSVAPAVPAADLVFDPEMGSDLQPALEPEPSPFLTVNFTELKQRNSDIVAWLKVDAVNIDMPIVQTTNNDFYLDHDLDKKPNALGWVFADTRSSTDHLGQNTVLYGHNALNDSMFGSLKELLNASEATKSEAQVIQFTTPQHKMLFEIVSVYVTDETDSEYVKQVFTSDADRQEFVDNIIKKNQVQAFTQTSLSQSDKFLTFSTCHGAAGTPKRLAVVAKLVSIEG